jgi:hypothetical protein
MGKYKCPRCGYNTNVKNCIQRHIVRKNICKPKIKDIDLSKIDPEILHSSDVKEYTCKTCNKLYSRKDNLHRHMKKCASEKIILTKCKCIKLLDNYEELLVKHNDLRDKVKIEHNKMMKLYQRCRDTERQNNLQQQQIKDLQDQISKIIEKDKEGCIYLLQEREFLKDKEDTYKIGHTTQKLLTRMSQYPKGSRIVYSSVVPNSKDSETNLKKLFNEKFTHKPEYGTEYFNGNLYEMIQTINEELMA